MNSSNFKQDLTLKAVEIFNKNTFKGYSRWHKLNYRFIAPANKEYIFQWLWDTAFHAIVLSRIDVEWAKNEIKNFLLGQGKDGLIPHVIFWGNRFVLPHWAYMESKLSLRPRTTSITQPPVLAIAIEAIFKKSSDKRFLKEVLPKIAKYHRWLLENRDPDNDNLLSIISPNESGMDELPVFQYALGFTGLDPARMKYFYRKADLLNLLHGYNNKLILNKNYFDVEEILFNCVFIEANRSLSRLFKVIGNNEEADFFDLTAKKAETALLNKCWDEKDKIFYSLFSNPEKKAKIKTVASLIPLFLDGLKGRKLKLLVEKHLLNKKEFWTPYPIPSVSKDEIYYSPVDSPYRGIKLLWRGPTWINTNWFIVKGLRKHGYDEVADEIVRKMSEMIEREGFREYYNPETGVGYRRQNFGWSTLLLDLI